MRKKLLLISFFTTFLGVLLGYLLERDASQGESIIKVGVIAYLSGDVAQIGQQYLKGVELGVDQYNRKGRERMIRLYVEDGKNSSRDAVSAYNKLMTQGVDVILMVGDNHVNSVSPLSTKKKIPVISSIAGATAFLNQNLGNERSLFLDWISIALISQKLADFASHSANIKTVSLLTLEDEYGKEAADYFSTEFKAGGGLIVASESYAYDSRNVTPQVLKVLQKKPDAVFVAGYGGAYVNVINTLKQFCFSGIILTDTSIMNPESRTGVSDFAKIIFADSRYNDFPRSDGRSMFEEQYIEKFGEAPTLFSSFGFDGILLVGMAIQLCSFDIRQGLDSLHDVATLNGVLSFDEIGAAQLPLVLRRMDKDGSVHDVIEK